MKSPFQRFKDMNIRELIVRTVVCFIFTVSPISVHADSLAATDLSSFTAFESGHVRPLVLSPDGKRLYAVNTPDNRLEVFAVDENGLTPLFSIPVGMEPVAVAMPDNSEVWVVNHVSDSVSVVAVGDDSAGTRVVRTLLVGDEPRDIVFAGENKHRAFITCAHRGQNNPNDPQLTQQGVGRADVWVFDRENLGSSLGGAPETILTLFGDTPRALAADPNGDKVYAAVFYSGNRTTSIVNFPFLPLLKAAPTTSPAGVPAPRTGLIVKYDGSRWVDETNRDYSLFVLFDLPDYDVFAIDATAETPQFTSAYSGVGTILFNMTVNPVNGSIYVSNTEAMNHVRFEGSGERGTSVRSHFLENRIAIIQDNAVVSRHLNKHLDYTKALGDENDRQLSCATPLEMAVSSDGKMLYMVAFGSQKVVRIKTAELENDSFVPNADDQLLLSAGGPSGIVLDEKRDRIYVFTRFNNGISMIDAETFTEEENIPLFSPEPERIVEGRPFLYDAALSSGFGDASCAGCHVFGDSDGLAWDLGNPDNEVVENANDYAAVNYQPEPQRYFHPLKGPMVTQSLRGIGDSGPLHWRGDRSGKDRLPEESVASAAFKEFNGTFVNLLGRETFLTDEQMQKFTDFALSITYPPNPIRALDNSLTELQAEGKRIFFEDYTSSRLFGRFGPAMNQCVQCHELDPSEDKYGTGGKMANVVRSEDFKVPHLRNLYQKVGRFGIDSVLKGLPWDLPQVRGFGFDNDGVQDTLLTHFTFGFFDLSGGKEFAEEIGSPAKGIKAQALTEFLMAFDSNLKPIVGQQITLTPDSGSDVLDRIALFLQQAGGADQDADCELVVKGRLTGSQRGWVMINSYSSEADTVFQSDRVDQQHTFEQLKEIAQEDGQELTFTCVPPGSGMRMGIDRDADGVYDADEETGL